MKRIRGSHRASSVERLKVSSRRLSSASSSPPPPPPPGHSLSLTAASEDAAELSDDGKLQLFYRLS